MYTRGADPIDLNAESVIVTKRPVNVMHVGKMQFWCGIQSLHKENLKQHIYGQGSWVGSECNERKCDISSHNGSLIIPSI